MQPRMDKRQHRPFCCIALAVLKDSSKAEAEPMKGAKGLVGLNEFLGLSKNKLQRLQSAPHSVAHVVMGNEASDMDSMVSSALHAYFRSFCPLVPSTDEKEYFYIPVMNIPREDFSLRTEAAWLFEKVGVAKDNLVFLDDVDLQNLLERKQMVLTLLDHNKLSGLQSVFSDVVLEILDHHKDEKLYTNTTVRRTIEPVGSATTLVTAEILADSLCKETIIDYGTAQLLAGPMLVDTANFSPSAARFNEKDTDTFARLCEACPEIERETLFKKLQFEKFNVLSLCSRDLLRKDYKEWDNIPYKEGGDMKTSIKMGISSVGLSIDAWCGKEKSFCEELRRWNRERQLDLLLCMNAFTDERSGNFMRQLVVYVDDESTCTGLFDRFVGFLHNHKVVEAWELTSLDAHTILHDKEVIPAAHESRLAFLAQGNSTASRKVIQPGLMEGFFQCASSSFL